jgi:hypothetical protein
MPCFQGKTKPLSEQFQYNLALFGLNQFNLPTEDFTEGFCPHPLSRPDTSAAGFLLGFLIAIESG